MVPPAQQPEEGAAGSSWEHNTRNSLSGIQLCTAAARARVRGEPAARQSRDRNAAV